MWVGWGLARAPLGLTSIELEPTIDDMKGWSSLIEIKSHPDAVNRGLEISSK